MLRSIKTIIAVGDNLYPNIALRSLLRSVYISNCMNFFLPKPLYCFRITCSYCKLHIVVYLFLFSQMEHNCFVLFRRCVQLIYVMFGVICLRNLNKVDSCTNISHFVTPNTTVVNI